MAYDGSWWLDADAATRTGFLEGIRDYMVSNGEKWFLGSTEYGAARITEFYNRTMQGRSLLVPAAWKRVLAEAPPPKPSLSAEIWEGPHGYYLGRWYYTGTKLERLGYLEAYLWCLRAYGKVPSSDYPQSLEFYDAKIMNELMGNEGPAWHEPVADVLARFRVVRRN